MRSQTEMRLIASAAQEEIAPIVFASSTLYALSCANPTAPNSYFLSMNSGPCAARTCQRVEVSIFRRAKRLEGKRIGLVRTGCLDMFGSFA